MLKFYTPDMIPIVEGFFMNALLNQLKKRGYKSYSLYAIVALCITASVFLFITIILFMTVQLRKLFKQTWQK